MGDHGRKSVYITTKRSEDHNQRSDGIAAHPKKFRKKNSPENSRLEFWDQPVILLIDNLPKGQTINAEYYSSLLVQLRGILKEKECRNSPR